MSLIWLQPFLFQGRILCVWSSFQHSLHLSARGTSTTKFTFTSRRRPASPLLLKLFSKSSQPRQAELESDWKTLKRSILSGVQMPLWTPGKHSRSSLLGRGQHSHPPSITTTSHCWPEASWMPTRIGQFSAGLCTCQFWFQCLNYFSESISMKITELSNRKNDPFFIALFNSVQERNELWPNRIKEGLQLLQRLSAVSAAEQLHSNFGLFPRACPLPADDPHWHSVNEWLHPPLLASPGLGPYFVL